MAHPPPPELIERLEPIVRHADYRLLEELREGVADAFIFLGNRFIDEESHFDLAEACFRFAIVLAALRHLAQHPGRESLAEAARLVPAAGLAHQAEAAAVPRHALPSVTQVFANVSGVLEFLHAEHVDGRYVYRGQTVRRAPHRITDVAGNEFVYENLFPHDFRFINDPAMADRTLMARHLATTRAKASRHCFDFIGFVTSEPSLDMPASRALRRWLLSRDPQEMEAIRELHRLVDAGAPHLAIPGFTFGPESVWRLLWSLAQHYELSTALLDVTYSPSVAAWFATRDWSESRPAPQEGYGVVYRFDLIALEGLLALFGIIEGMQANDRMGLPASPRVAPFIQDLRSIPPDCARRPLGQQGASLYGLDSIWLLEAVSATGVLEVFEFEHAAMTDVGVDRQTIMPTADPFVEVAEAFRSSLPH